MRRTAPFGLADDTAAMLAEVDRRINQLRREIGRGPGRQAAAAVQGIGGITPSASIVEHAPDHRDGGTDEVYPAQTGGLIPDASFESKDSSLPLWTKAISGNGVTPVQDNTQRLIGAYSCKLSISSLTAGVDYSEISSVFVPITAIAPIRVRVYLISTNGTEWAKVFVDWYNASKGLISSSTVKDGIVTTAWLSNPTNLDPPDLTSFLKVRIRQTDDGTAGNVFVDDVMVYRLGLAEVGLRKNSAGTVFQRRRVNLIEGTNITLTVADDATNEEVDVTIASTDTGEANTSSNAGTGEGQLAKAKSGVDLPFKTIKQATGITVTNNADDVTLTPSLPYIRNEIIVVVAGTLTASTSVPKVGYMKAPAALTIEQVVCEVDTAPTGAAIIVDIHKIPVADIETDFTGTTIYTTQANRPTLAIDDRHVVATLPDVTSIAQGDVLRIYVDQIGSTVAGADLTVAIRVRQSAAWS